MRDIYKNEIAPSVRKIEDLAGFINDPLAGEYKEQQILTPQQIKRSVQKWHSQFVSRISSSCIHVMHRWYIQWLSNLLILDIIANSM